MGIRIMERLGEALSELAARLHSQFPSSVLLFLNLLICFEVISTPKVGLELTTSRLRVARSTSGADQVPQSPCSIRGCLAPARLLPSPLGDTPLSPRSRSGW